MKGKRTNTKKTVQFNLEDTMLFHWDAKERLGQLPINAIDEEIFTAYRATLKLNN